MGAGVHDNMGYMHSATCLREVEMAAYCAANGYWGVGRYGVDKLWNWLGANDITQRDFIQ
jgi:hypothetical protein